MIELNAIATAVWRASRRTRRGNGRFGVFQGALLLLAAIAIFSCARKPLPPEPDRLEFLSANPRTPEPGTLDYAYSQTIQIALSESPPRGVKPPEALPAGALWGRAPFGEADGTLCLLLAPAREGRWRFWIDGNLNGDLRDDPPRLWNPLARPVLTETLEIRGDSPGDSAMPAQRARLTVASVSPLNSSPARRATLTTYASWRGEARFGETRRKAAVFPATTRWDELPPASRFIVDLNGDGILETNPDSPEHFSASDAVPMDGRAWRLARLDRPTGGIVFELAGDTAPRRPALRVGDPAPRFEARTVDGEPVSLAGLAGSIVLLQFWSAATPGYEWDIADLRHLHETYAWRGLAIVRMNLDQPDPSRPDNAPLLDAPWIELAGRGGRDDPVARLYRVWQPPWTLLIDRNGLIVAKNLSAPALSLEIGRMMHTPR